MNIRTIFDKFSLDTQYRTGWGVSFLVDDSILFDTGENGDWLIHNMKTMKVDFGKIDAVVISHDHWDHTGGLWTLLKIKPSITVYACPGFSAAFKQNVRKLGSNLIETDAMTEISPNIYAGKEIIGVYKEDSIAERALVIDGNSGVSIITGCAHPGVVKIVRVVMEAFRNKQVSLVMGGFHLMGNTRDDIQKVVEEFREMRVQLAGPTHCTGDETENVFKEEYGKNFISIIVGDAVVVT